MASLSERPSPASFWFFFLGKTFIRKPHSQTQVIAITELYKLSPIGLRRCKLLKQLTNALQCWAIENYFVLCNESNLDSRPNATLILSMHFHSCSRSKEVNKKQHDNMVMCPAAEVSSWLLYETRECQRPQLKWTLDFSKCPPKMYVNVQVEFVVASMSKKQVPPCRSSTDWPIITRWLL